MDQLPLEPDAPLCGYKVVDASTHLAGPFAGLMLADLGATVIKVEPPSGDPLRTFTGPASSVGQLATSINRNKRSVSFDLKTEEDRESFLDLISTADVLLHNWRATTEEHLDLHDEVIAARNEQLVRVAITGFGTSGPKADEPAFDQIIQALSGLAVRQGEPDEPSMVGTYIADKTSSMFAVQAVLAGLLRRATTNTGVRVDVPMLDAMAYSNFPDLYEGRIYLDHTPDLQPPRRLRSLARTSDGHIVIAPGTGRQLKRTLEIAGHPEWKEELIEIRDRTIMLSRLLELLEPLLSTSPTDHWVQQFVDAGIPCAPVLHLDDHLQHPQVVHNGTYDSYEHPVHGKVLAARYPARFRGLRDVPLSPIPSVNEDSGLSWEREPPASADAPDATS